MRKKIAVFVVVAALLVIGAMGSAQAATGSQLISQYGCLGCHNPIPTASTNAGEVTLITNGLNTIPAMSSMMNSLSAADIQAIADYLVPAAPAGPAACTSYTYTLGACQPNGTAPVVSSVGVPAGCSGGATPATTQPCTYTPPTSASAMPLPASEQVFPYDPVASAVASPDPNQAMPMGLGAVATGGNTLTLHITAAFQSPVKIYVTMYTPSSVSFIPSGIKMLNGKGKFKMPLAGAGGMQLKNWKNGVTTVDETIINNVPLSQLKAGLYYVVMTATPATGNQNFDQWVTYFIVP